MAKFIVRREPEVESLIARLSELAKQRVERNIDKLESRGFGVVPPLAEHVGGDVYMLITEITTKAYICIGFFAAPDGKRFRAFWARETSKARLSGKERKSLLQAFADLSGG